MATLPQGLYGLRPPNPVTMALVGEPPLVAGDPVAALRAYAATLPPGVAAGPVKTATSGPDWGKIGDYLLTKSWPSRMVQAAWGAATLPGDVYAGRVDPSSDEGIARANDLAGLVTLGSGAVPGEAGALRAGIDRTKTGWTFRDVASPNRDLTKADNQRISKYIGVREEILPIRSLYATQEKVNPDFAVTQSSSGELPFVIRKNGKLYLQDGHHRVTKVADQGGQNVRVRFMDLDQADTSAPLLDWKPVSDRDKKMIDDLLAELGDPESPARKYGIAGLIGGAAGAATMFQPGQAEAAPMQNGLFGLRP